MLLRQFKQERYFIDHDVPGLFPVASLSNKALYTHPILGVRKVLSGFRFKYMLDLTPASK